MEKDTDRRNVKIRDNLQCFNANVDSKQFKGINLVNNQFWKYVLKCWLNSVK